MSRVGLPVSVTPVGRERTFDVGVDPKRQGRECAASNRGLIDACEDTAARKRFSSLFR